MHVRLADRNIVNTRHLAENSPNPWRDLPTEPDFVLEQDREIVAAHNAATTDEHRLQLHVLPEPFMGPRDAPVVLLNLNPGYHPSDVANYAQLRRASVIRGALVHELDDDEAFYFLTEEFEGTGGWNWWTRKLNPLIQKVGLTSARRGIQVIEYAPYKSARYKSPGKILPSQIYTFNLVREAVTRDALVVVMRHHDEWLRSVPELAGVAVHRLRNPQNVTIGPGNCPSGFAEILTRLS